MTREEVLLQWSWQELVDECIKFGATIDFHPDYHSKQELVDFILSKEEDN